MPWRGHEHGFAVGRDETRADLIRGFARAELLRNLLAHLLRERGGRVRDGQVFADRAVQARGNLLHLLGLAGRRVVAHRHGDHGDQASHQREQHQQPGQARPRPVQRLTGIHRAHWAPVSIELITLVRAAPPTGPMTWLTIRPEEFTTNVSGTPRRPYASAVFEPASATTGYVTPSVRT